MKGKAVQVAVQVAEQAGGTEMKKSTRAQVKVHRALLCDAVRDASREDWVGEGLDGNPVLQVLGDALSTRERYVRGLNAERPWRLLAPRRQPVGRVEFNSIFEWTCRHGLRRPTGRQAKVLLSPAKFIACLHYENARAMELQSGERTFAGIDQQLQKLATYETVLSGCIPPSSGQHRSIATYVSAVFDCVSHTVVVHYVGHSTFRFLRLVFLLYDLARCYGQLPDSLQLGNLGNIGEIEREVIRSHLSVELVEFEGVLHEVADEGKVNCSREAA